MTADISAHLFDPRQNYVSVRLQQGRVITDLDWNENERIERTAQFVSTLANDDEGLNLLITGPAGSGNPNTATSRRKAKRGVAGRKIKK